MQPVLYELRHLRTEFFRAVIKDEKLGNLFITHAFFAVNVISWHILLSRVLFHHVLDYLVKEVVQNTSHKNKVILNVRVYSSFAALFVIFD